MLMVEPAGLHINIPKIWKKYTAISIFPNRNLHYIWHRGFRECVPVESFNPVLDRNIPILANKLAKINADAAVNATRMRIK
jgi:hypothetical protein